MWQSIPIERIVHCSCAVLIPTCRDRNDGRKSDKVRQTAKSAKLQLGIFPVLSQRLLIARGDDRFVVIRI
jgi:hypothetical protein